MATNRRGLFVIAVAAERADLPIQNLRGRPAARPAQAGPTSGGTRLYSEADIVLLRRIGALLDDGLNLAGIGRVLELEAEIARLRTLLDRRGR